MKKKSEARRTVMLDAKLHQRLKIVAVKKGVQLNTVLDEAVRAWLVGGTK